MKFVFFLFIAAGFMGGCNYNRSKIPGAGAGSREGQQKVDMGALDFATVQSVVLGPKCVGCHKAYSRYDAVKTALADIREAVFVLRTMPQRPLVISAGEKEILAAWFDQGAPEFVNQEPPPEPEPGLPPTPEPTPPVTWEFIRDNVFNRCTSCHSHPNPDDGLDMEDLATNRFKANRIFQRVFVTKDMPPPPSKLNTPEEREWLLKWFDLGMPE